MPPKPRSNLRAVRRRLALSAAALLALAAAFPASAAGGPSPADSDWEAAVRSRGLDPATVVNPVAVTPELSAVAHELAGDGDPFEQLSRLQRALVSESQLDFEYDEETTLTADEALRRRAGNCLSFTSLFIAMARSLGQTVHAALPVYEPTGRRAGNLVVVNDHIVAVHEAAHGFTVFDFNRAGREPAERVEVLDDLALASRHMSNRAVELLRGEHAADAAALLESAVRLDPRNVGALGNLGVARRRSGDWEGALDAYEAGLRIAPHDPTLVNDLGALYLSRHMVEAARETLREADLDRASVDVLLQHARLTLRAGDVERTLKLYKRAHRADPARPEPLVGIARMELARGRLGPSRRAAARAYGLAPSREETRELLRTLREVSGPAVEGSPDAGRR